MQYERVKSYPQFLFIKYGRWVVFILCFLILLPLCIWVFSTIGYDDPFFQIFMIVSGIFILGMMIAVVVFYHMMYQVCKKVENLRQLAVQGNKNICAHDQPDSQLAKSISLPFTLDLHPRKKPYVLLFIIVYILVNVCILVQRLWIEPSSDVPPVFTILVSLIATFLLWGLHILASYSSSCICLTATETGLQQKEPFKKAVLIPWYDARLFATSIKTQQKGATNGELLPFELASRQALIQWVVVQPADFRYAQLTTYEEYRQQMDVLHSIIVAKTGLSLYNLHRD